MFKQCLQTMMEKVARIVSSNYGVSVVFQGATAYTDGKSIVLPSLPPDASPDLVQDMQGYLDHEVAHVLFTEFNAVKGCKNHFHKWLSNHAEDSRIELEMIATYPGTRLHLHPLNEKWTKIIGDKWSEVSLMNRICLNVRAIQDGRETRLDADTKPLFTKKVVALSKSLRKAKNTWEIIEICGKILREIDKNQKEEEQKPEEQKQQEKAEQEKKEQEQKSEAGKEEKKESEKTDEKNSDEEEGAGESEKSEEGEESDEEGDDEGSDSEENENGESGESGDEESEEDGEQDGEGGEGEEASEDDAPYDGKLSSEALKEELEASDESDCEDVHAYMDEQIKEEIKEEKEKEKEKNVQTPQERRFDNSKRHLPFTTRYDEVKDFSNERCPDYKAIQQLVRATVTKLVVELERVFKVKEEDRTILEQERGRISSKGLTRLVMDKNYRTPFKVRIKQETKNVAVQVVVDLSGSMRGQKVYVAQMVAAAVAEALAKLGIDCEVVGFQTGNVPRSAYDSMSGDLSRYNRTTDTLIHFLFKPFGSKNLEPISKMGAGGANCDGESIRWAAKRLEQHKAKRKVMMVLSDGMPQCGSDPNILNSDLKRAVKEITASGIECVGIGIQSEAVKHFYPDYIVVNSLGDLVTTTLKKLKAILTV